MLSVADSGSSNITREKQRMLEFSFRREEFIKEQRRTPIFAEKPHGKNGKDMTLPRSQPGISIDDNYCTYEANSLTCPRLKAPHIQTPPPTRNAPLALRMFSSYLLVLIVAAVLPRKRHRCLCHDLPIDSWFRAPLRG